MTVALPWPWVARPDGSLDPHAVQANFDALALALGTQAGRGPITLRIPVNYVIGGSVDATTVVPEVPITLATGQTAAVVNVFSHITSGTSIDVQLRRNGSSVGSAVTVTTTAATVARAQALSTGDLLDLVLSAPVGTPKDLTFSIVVDHTV